MSSGAQMPSLTPSLTPRLTLSPTPHRALSLTLTAALLGLAACSTDPAPQYIVRQDGQRLSREQAQRQLVQQYLALQVQSQLDLPLKVLAAPLPDYPARLRVGPWAVSGVVPVSFHVQADGRVTDIALRGQAPPELAELCLAVLPQWRFSPVSRGGRPLVLGLRYDFVFRLED